MQPKALHRLTKNKMLSIYTHIQMYTSNYTLVPWFFCKYCIYNKYCVCIYNNCKDVPNKIRCVWITRVLRWLWVCIMGLSECTVMICLTCCTAVAVATAWRVPILLEEAFCSSQAIMYSTPEAKFFTVSWFFRTSQRRRGVLTSKNSSPHPADGTRRSYTSVSGVRTRSQKTLGLRASPLLPPQINRPPERLEIFFISNTEYHPHVTFQQDFSLHIKHFHFLPQ